VAGRILVGSKDGVYVLLFEGDVRLTLCTAVDGYLDKMFHDQEFGSVVVDLSRTDSIDSTSLGVLAKLSIKAQKLFDYTPTLVSTEPDITRILLSMGFEDVFHIVEEPLQYAEQLGELPPVKESRDDLRQRVLNAHRTLMAMNESNRAAFQDLVATLEAEPPSEKDTTTEQRCA
jgi:anti-anti-sigma factor